MARQHQKPSPFQAFEGEAKELASVSWRVPSARELAVIMRFWRIRAELTQQDVADAVGLHRNSVIDIESMKAIPSLATVILLVDYLQAADKKGRSRARMRANRNRLNTVQPRSLADTAEALMDV